MNNKYILTREYSLNNKIKNCDTVEVFNDYLSASNYLDNIYNKVSKDSNYLIIFWSNDVLKYCSTVKNELGTMTFKLTKYEEEKIENNIIKEPSKFYLFNKEQGEKLKEMYEDMCLKCKVEGWKDDYQYFLTEGAYYDYCINNRKVFLDNKSNNRTNPIYINNLYEVYAIIKIVESEKGKKDKSILVEYVCDTKELALAMLDKALWKVKSNPKCSDVKVVGNFGFSYKKEDSIISFVLQKVPFVAEERDATKA